MPMTLPQNANFVSFSSKRSLAVQDQHQAKGCGKLKELLCLKITSKFDPKAFIHCKSMCHSSLSTRRILSEHIPNRYVLSSYFQHSDCRIRFKQNQILVLIERQANFTVYTESTMDLHKE